MRILVKCAVMSAVLASLVIGSGTASAYTLERSIPAKTGNHSLADRGMRLYENTQDISAGHEGWCYPSGKNPGTWWACTVKSRSYPASAGGSNISAAFAMDFAEGEVKNIYGISRTARHAAPKAGWRPYCAFDRIIKGSHEDAYGYKCAYWI